MKRTILFIMLILFPVMTAQAEISIMAGSADTFNLPADPASPSADFQRVILAIDEAIYDFDMIAGLNGALENTCVAHTFSALPPDIVSATLELRVRGGQAGDVYTDGIILSFVDTATSAWVDAIAWHRSFGPQSGGGPIFADADPGILDVWDRGEEASLVLDLSALPNTDGSSLNLIPQINARGFMDVAVNDETGIDFMRLNYTVPEPATLLLLGLGAFAIRKKR